MNAMAIDAHGHPGVAPGEKFAVHTGLILGQLVGAQGRVVLPHESRIGVTATAKLGDIFAFDLSAKSDGAVATRARQAFLRVDVARKLLFADLEGRVEGSMTSKAGVLRLRMGSAAAEKER